MIKKLLPLSFKNKLKFYVTKLRILYSKHAHKKKLKDIIKKDKIKVAFLVVNGSIWKYERLYFLLENDYRFYPVVYVCPFLTYGEDLMKKEMNSTYDSFKSQNYNVIKTLKEDGSFIDVKKEFCPDLVFFCTPWDHSQPQYQIINFLDVLTCYVHYGFNTVKSHYFNMMTTLLSWKVFVETDYHKESAKNISLNKGRNFIVSGYPGIDSLIDNKYKSKKVWKIQETAKKKIIWAPHHSVGGIKGRNVFHSTFMAYSEFMLEIAEKYKDKIQFSFKPHPNLRGKLSKPEIWGVKKTNEYYNAWKNMSNGQLNEGDYLDLFIESDAMIHDSSSFLIEYFYTKKPSLFLLEEIDLKQLNRLGLEALESMQKGYSKEDVLKFIETVVIDEIDGFEEIRSVFHNKWLMPPNNKLASENIFCYLKEQFRS